MKIKSNTTISHSVHYSTIKINTITAVLLICGLMLSTSAMPTYASNLNVQPLATVTQNNVTIAVTWLHIDTKRVAIEYTVSGLKQGTANQPSGCPIHGVTLQDENGQQLGKGEPTTRCIMDENWNFRVTQSFYDNLASLKSNPVKLHFVTTVLSSGQRSAPDAQGNYTDLPGSPTGEFSFDLTARPEKDLTIQQSLARSGNGVIGLLRSVEFNPSFVASEICITLPSTADWLPQTSLVAGQSRILADSWEILNFKQSKAWTSRNRCYRFTFPATLDLNQTPNFQIEVDRLVTSLPEMISESMCNSARDKLAASTSGIAIACHATANGYNFEVAQKPNAMSVDDAYRKATLAFSDVVEGPWTFTVATQ